jgi:hypothetical protein
LEDGGAGVGFDGVEVFDDGGDRAFNSQVSDLPVCAAVYPFWGSAMEAVRAILKMSSS